MTQRKLLGVVPARHLLAADPAELVEEVMITDVVAIPSWATVLVASEYFASRKLLAFPVIHDNGELVGVVDVSLFTNEVIDLARRTYDDIFQLLGVHATAMRTPWTAFRRPLPLAAVEHRGRPAVRGHRLPIRDSCSTTSSSSRCSSPSCWRWPRA